MYVERGNFFHLTYCTNIHPGNGWSEVYANLQRYAPALKARFAPHKAFGIGLRLSGRESRELLQGDHLQQFQDFLQEHGLYVFTLNGFPYGPFHRQSVKAEVHAPDWRDEERVAYTLRLIEILSKLQKDTGVRPLTLMSGYRSPTYNEALRASGARAAGGSLHTEGLAADVAFPRKLLKPLWMKLRAMDCCGAGYYAKEGFLHIDVGRPRFWEPATSRVEENLSAGNALVFARTEYDRYRVGERISIAIHAVTVPPVLLAEVAETEPATKATLRLAPPARRPDRCVAVDETGANVELDGELPSGRRRLLLKTCDAEPQNAPRLVATNAFEVR